MARPLIGFEKNKKRRIQNSLKVTVFLPDFCLAGGLSLYFIQKFLLKMKKYNNYNKRIVKQVIKMVIVIVKDPRYITES